MKALVVVLVCVCVQSVMSAPTFGLIGEFNSLNQFSTTLLNNLFRKVDRDIKDFNANLAELHATIYGGKSPDRQEPNYPEVINYPCRGYYCGRYPGWQNPGGQDPGWQNPGWQNPGWQNPDDNNEGVPTGDDAEPFPG